MASDGSVFLLSMAMELASEAGNDAKIDGRGLRVFDYVAYGLKGRHHGKA
jgi:hypothetical protein